MEIISNQSPHKAKSLSTGAHPNDAGPDDCTPSRRLTRQRKLRQLSDLGFSFFHSTDSFSASPEPRYHSASEHRSLSSLPQPLPLPEAPLTRRAKSVSSGSVHPPLSASVEHPNFSSSGKALPHDAVTREKPTLHLDSTPANAKYNLREHIPAASFLTGHSSLKNRRAASHGNDSEVNPHLNLGVVAKPKSAPTSVVTSPDTSPYRSNNIDFFDSTFNFSSEVNDKLKMLSAKSVHSPDHSLIHCPLGLTRYFNPKIEEGSQNHKFLSKVCPENNHLDAHPLPLPPRASSPAQLSVLHQSSSIHHATETMPSVKGQWQKGKLIGRGTFGRVFHATNLENGASCAMKEINLIPDDPTSAECMKQLDQEIKILHQLNHPNIVRYYGSEIVGNHLYIYMEYVHPGSISKFMREHCGAMTESVVRNFTRHILSGLAYLHSNKTIHRDIKGANLLVNGSGIVKLADFGLAKILMGNSYDLSLKGSPYWMAPEVVKGSIKNESNLDVVTGIDIWSLGCTIIEMLTGKPPWSEAEGASAMFKALQESPPIPETLSSVGKDFLQKCFQRDPADRPSSSTLLKHAFVQNLHDQYVLGHPQSFPRGDLGPGGNSASPRDTTTTRSGIIQASSSSRCFNKIQKLVGDTSEQINDHKESNHVIPFSHSHVPEVNILQSTLKPGTLNYMSAENSRNISTMMRMITNF
ncbi:Mitogen-activated protein [Vigna angularis]|uniref:mitogen-activated protein kinase kinase kinase n=1 Tax=Phaseolus angularis TaxID=3914 RepID=A0A8T0K051_PHAAN|nr:mitogen-activated protein kinase kinase kinase 5 [Vigna angularis]XP_052735766.1 mitogen-activated protein kinase kinase kinase 5 [Vigna angularis]XP_052735767.1 mitogen-activated protein kinase kinase kinase 5 [Vigna angularis]XP_052735768.1 mitogen-activated protein kinase kinase kinase 5 [Vigna angularis]XP_052735769.1 mitogen-activated protein kinase kinase kinase 5 [Vigna angularis]XP_052735770.1 mitogen-activated protein kinase kinase kinase 5 [Vigna angularis]XP_052735771.1 mitogen-